MVAGYGHPPRHAGARAIQRRPTRAALASATRTPDRDAIVLLGDLLTYGCDPLEVLEELERCRDRLPMVWIWGNHDAFYHEVLGGNPERLDELGWRRLAVGIFGHTHRAHLFSRSSRGETDAVSSRPWIPPSALTIGPGERLVANVGSVGQPRSSPPVSTLGWLRRLGEGRVEITLEAVDHDPGLAVASIEASDLSREARDRLSAYLRGAG